MSISSHRRSSRIRRGAAALGALLASACGAASDEGVPASSGGTAAVDAGGLDDSTSGGRGGVAASGAGGSLSGGEGSGGMGGADTGGSGADRGGTSGASGCLDGITDYASGGPFSFQSTRSGQVNFWVPDVPAGCKVPIAHLANGTGARCSSYRAILEHLASHGFLAACYEDTNTGQGTQCLSAVETALSEYPDLTDNKVGSTGHSQGGGGAILCVYRVEQQLGDGIDIVGHAMEPAHGFGDSPSDWASLYAEIRSPIFMFNGSRDTLVSAAWVRRGFNALDSSVEAYWYQAEGARHIPVPTSWTQESAVSWFRWKLLGDRQACEYFKDLPNSRQWSHQAAQNETDC